MNHHRLYYEMLDRAMRGVEDADPADNEPIVDRLDLTQGFTKGNVHIVCGLVYKFRHRPFAEARAMLTRFPTDALCRLSVNLEKPENASLFDSEKIEVVRAELRRRIH